MPLPFPKSSRPSPSLSKSKPRQQQAPEQWQQHDETTVLSQNTNVIDNRKCSVQNKYNDSPPLTSPPLSVVARKSIRSLKSKAPRSLREFAKKCRGGSGDSKNDGVGFGGEISIPKRVGRDEGALTSLGDDEKTEASGAAMQRNVERALRTIEKHARMQGRSPLEIVREPDEGPKYGGCLPAARSSDILAKIFDKSAYRSRTAAAIDGKERGESALEVVMEPDEDPRDGRCLPPTLPGNTLARSFDNLAYRSRSAPVIDDEGDAFVDTLDHIPHDTDRRRANSAPVAIDDDDGTAVDTLGRLIRDLDSGPAKAADGPAQGPVTRRRKSEQNSGAKKARKSKLLDGEELRGSEEAGRRRANSVPVAIDDDDNAAVNTLDRLIRDLDGGAVQGPVTRYRKSEKNSGAKKARRSNFLDGEEPRGGREAGLDHDEAKVSAVVHRNGDDDGISTEAIHQALQKIERHARKRGVSAREIFRDLEMEGEVSSRDDAGGGDRVDAKLIPDDGDTAAQSSELNPPPGKRSKSPPRVAAEKALKNLGDGLARAADRGKALLARTASDQRGDYDESAGTDEARCSPPPRDDAEHRASHAEEARDIAEEEKEEIDSDMVLKEVEFALRRIDSHARRRGMSSVQFALALDEEEGQSPRSPSDGSATMTQVHDIIRRVALEDEPSRSARRHRDAEQGSPERAAREIGPSERAKGDGDEMGGKSEPPPGGNNKKMWEILGESYSDSVNTDISAEYSGQELEGRGSSLANEHESDEDVEVTLCDHRKVALCHASPKSVVNDTELHAFEEVMNAWFGFVKCHKS